jgi:hypothetical protein
MYSGRACCYSVQNFYSSSIQNIKIKLYRAIILPVLYECETWSLTLSGEHRLRVFENRVGEEIKGDWRRLHSEELYNLYFSTK